MVRINDLARELGVKSKNILDALVEVGITKVKTHSSSLEDKEADMVRVHFRAHPDKYFPSPWSPPQADTFRTRIDLSHITRPGDVLKAITQAGAKPAGTTVDVSHISRPGEILKAIMRPQTTPAQKAKEALKVAPVTPLNRGINPDAQIPAQGLSSNLQLPEGFSFYTRGFVDFDHVIQHFDWNLRERALTIDLSACTRSNFQSLALLVQYAWHLTLNGCIVRFKYGTAQSGPTKMLSSMGALDWREVLVNDGRDFGNIPGRKTYALRRRSDVQSTINNARKAIRNYSIGFPEYLSYIISELLYNATEHGRHAAVVDKCQVLVPSVFQFGLYPQLNRLSFLFSDLGIGIKAHLEQSYPPFPTHQEAIIYALRPNVSGTFRQQSQPYSMSDNAGMGLTYSSLMLKRLKGDMYIVSHDAVVHVSPEDITSHQIRNYWPGTFVLINLNVGSVPAVSLEDLMAEIRMSAQKELDGASQKEESDRYPVSMFNYFGKYAEDKDAAITFRDRHLMPALENGKKIDLDFRDVETAPHSFLNALLATPVRRLGMKAYQWIRIYNAPGPIHEIIDKVLEDNLPKIQ